jgi:hypothetical protein
VIATGASTLMAIAADQSAASTVVMGARGHTTDALLIRMSTAPNSTRTWLTASATWPGSPRSALTVAATPPRPRIVLATSSSSSWERARIATFAPAAASPSDSERPMPRPAPVTSAALFSKAGVTTPPFVLTSSAQARGVERRPHCSLDRWTGCDWREHSTPIPRWRPPSAYMLYDSSVARKRDPAAPRGCGPRSKP